MPQSDRQREYREVYLRSWHWRQMRQLALDDSDGRCAVCNGTKALDVHHRTYERLGNERLNDLTVLCRGCHSLFHGSGKATKPKSKAKRPKAPAPKPRPQQVVTTRHPRTPKQSRQLQRQLRQRERVARVEALFPILEYEPFDVREIAQLTGLTVGQLGTVLTDLRHHGKVERSLRGGWKFKQSKDTPSS